MFLHRPEVYFSHKLDTQILCRVCNRPLQIKDGICYEGFVVKESDEQGNPTALLYVKVVLCSLWCITAVSLPNNFVETCEKVVQ